MHASKKLSYLCTLFGTGMSWLSVGLAYPTNEPTTPLYGMQFARNLSALDILSSIPAPSAVIEREEAPLPDDTATEKDNEGARPTMKWRSVSTTILDEMRGGFDTGSGLQISFGIQR